MAKLNANEKLINKAVKAAKDELAGTSICNNSITMNVDMGEALEIIAQAALENAKAINKLADSVVNSSVNAISASTQTENIQ